MLDVVKERPSRRLKVGVHGAERIRVITVGLCMVAEQLGSSFSLLDVSGRTRRRPLGYMMDDATATHHSPRITLDAKFGAVYSADRTSPKCGARTSK
jgi:hypothetical protein